MLARAPFSSVMLGEPCESDRVLGADDSFRRSGGWPASRFRRCFQDYRRCLILAVVAGGTAIALVLVVGQLLSSSGGDRADSSETEQQARRAAAAETCLTPVCVETAARIAEAMDPSRRPCDDFYGYACGGWTKRTHLDDHSLAEAMTMDRIQADVRDDLRDVLDREPGPEDPLGFIEAKHLFRACRKAKDITVDEETKAFLHRFIARYGGYLTELSNAEQVRSLVYFLATVGLAPWFAVTEGLDARTEYSTPIFHLHPPEKDVVANLYYPLRRAKRGVSYSSLPPAASSQAPIPNRGDEDPAAGATSAGINSGDDEDHEDEELPIPPRSQQISSSLLVQYLENQVDATAEMNFARTLLALGYGGDERTEEHRRLKEASKLLRRLRKLIPTTVNERRAQINLDWYHVYALKDLDKNFPVEPHISWHTLFETLVNKSLDGSEAVVVHDPQPLHQASELLRRHSLGTVRDALLTHFLKHLVTDMVLRHSRTPTANEHKCVDYVEAALPWQLAGMFVSRTPVSRVREMRREVQEMWETLKETVEETLPTLTWLGPSARSDTLQRIRNTRLEFGAADYFWDHHFHNAERVRLKNASFLEMYLDTVFSAHAASYDSACKSPDYVRSDLLWRPLMMPYSVNAFYVRQHNAVVVPLAFVLDTPYFSDAAPAFVKFGSLVQTLAHELIHVLEHRGQYLDAKGRKRNHWAQEDRDKFDAYATCFSEAYTSLFQNVTLKRRFYPDYDAAAAFPDNLGDSLGIDLTVLAYRKWVHKHGKDSVLPSFLSGADERLLLVQSAQMSCSVYDHWWIAYLLEMDEHTPAEQRVNGQMLNSAEFPKVFQCPLGSAMNPARQCR